MNRCMWGARRALWPSASVDSASYRMRMFLRVYRWAASASVSRICCEGRGTPQLSSIALMLQQAGLSHGQQGSQRVLHETDLGPANLEVQPGSMSCQQQQHAALLSTAHLQPGI